MADFNTGRVTFDFRDARKRPIRDEVRLTFDNFHVQSLNFRATIREFPQQLEMPAFPTGQWKVFVQPEHYRPKTFFLSVPSGANITAQEFFFLHADRARPRFPSTQQVFTEPLWAGLKVLLERSQIDEVTGRDLYDELLTEKNLLRLAGLLNLRARTLFVTLDSGRAPFSYFDRALAIERDRVFVQAQEPLHADVLRSVQRKILDKANGSLHEFKIPGGFKLLENDASFKTPEKAGNLQLTFGRNEAGVTAVDADVDEAKGIGHAFEVLGHVFTGGKTHPFDIHQILSFFYEGIDLGYDLEPA